MKGSALSHYVYVKSVKCCVLYFCFVKSGFHAPLFCSSLETCLKTTNDVFYILRLVSKPSEKRGKTLAVIQFFFFFFSIMKHGTLCTGINHNAVTFEDIRNSGFPI